MLCVKYLSLICVFIELVRKRKKKRKKKNRKRKRCMLCLATIVVVINSYYIVDDEGKTPAEEIGKLKCSFS